MFNKSAPLDPNMFVRDDERFNTLTMLSKAVKQFWDLTYIGITRASVASCVRHTKGDAHCQYLLDLLNWLMLQDDQKQRDTLRRINNSFGGLSPKEYEVRAVQAMLYKIFLHDQLYYKEKIISILFEVDQFLAKRVDQEVTATGLQGLVNLITGKSTALITHDPDTGQTKLSLPDHSKQLLITGTVEESPDGEKPETPPEPQYPGHIFNEEVIAANIDALVKSDFDISIDLREAESKKQSAEALGQLYTVICHIIDNRIPLYAASSERQISKAIKKFRTPANLKDIKINAFCNVLRYWLTEVPELREAIRHGLSRLAKAQPKLFNDLLWEVLGEIDKPVNFAGADDFIAKSDGYFMDKPIDLTSSIPVRPAKDKPEEKGLTSLSLIDLHPLNRLQTIYEQHLIDFKRLANYDPYCREAICLILCGKAHPEPDELDHGYRKWQKIVHPDKSPTPEIKDFSKLISLIGDLAKKREFIREETVTAITELFTLTKTMLEKHSITVIPRKGLRRIIVGQVPIEHWVKQNNYQQDKVRLIVNGTLIKIEDYATTALERGDIVELVIFD